MSKEIDIPHTETETLVEGLSDTFLVRRDLYARQLDDGRYVCIQKFLTPRHVIAHLKGDLTLGAYALNVDNRARFLAFDADDESQWSQLVRMAATLESQGAIGYLEASRRGGHLWLFFSRPVMGRAVREFGLGLVQAFQLEGIELFPKQAALKTGPGSLIRMPFGVHRRTGERYGFFKPDGQPLAASLEEQMLILNHPQNVPPPVFQAYRSLPNTAKESKEKAGNGPTEAPTGTLSERIKGSVSVMEFVSHYVELSPNGRGLCPFHDDQQASFSVDVKRNYWHCFAGCGGGSIIDFWMKKQGCDFKQAIKELAGMLLP
jgi:hypothetical protein